ncbi:MAG: hypothetical protein HYZ93_03575 [Candidatus Omnitrophica bacterium]|nr:hypothetical protein [Candidatus Omnitrophota bacterium]
MDDFEGEEITNRLGNRANVFIRAPSKAMASRREDTLEGKKAHVLMLRYQKVNRGGPFNSGGWCGYYTLLKSPEEKYLDGRSYHAITFWVRGEKGDEKFVVGLADRHWDKIGDSVKSQEIGGYLPGGKLTTQWQKATVPLDEFFLDVEQLAAIAIVFEGDLFPESGHAGTVYLKEIALE